MADVAMDMSHTTTPKKRNYEGEMIANTLSNNSVMRNTMSPLRNCSPAPSSASSLTELTNTEIQSLAPGYSSVEGASSKKRKLTFIEREAERAAKRREKEEKEKVKAEEKARKEQQKNDEKRKKEEEKESTKRTKELEKAERDKMNAVKKQEKDAKRMEKEVEKAKIEAEKLKKEKAQLKLAAFFGRPTAVSTPPSTPDDASEGMLSRRSSVISIDMEVTHDETKTPNKTTSNDFDKWFLPFYISEHTNLAPVNRHKLEQQSDFTLKETVVEDLRPLSTKFGRRRKTFRKVTPIRHLVEQLQDGLPDSTNHSNGDMTQLLCQVPYKYLYFHHDVRPPYQGTYTRTVSPRSSRRVSRNPFHRGLPDTNYDYDSEAEWEPPAEDDEDLNEEDEMSDAEENEEEMDDFLDDENDIGRKRGPICDMIPISTGICWQSEGDKADMNNYRMDVLHDSTTFPIDPFATTYWPTEAKPSPVKAWTEHSTTLMQPPRLPLATVSPNSISTIRSENGLLVPSQNENAAVTVKQRGRPPNPEKQLKMIESEFLPAFKSAIQGSDLTKAGLIEILKKQFPKCSKDAIKDTLGIVAIRVGKKEVEKKWQIIDSA